MSRRKQTTPNKVHCEYNVTQHCGILALAGLLWSEAGRRGLVRRYSLWGNGGYSCFILGTVGRETELCASEELAVSWQGRTGVGLNKQLML